LWRIVVDKLDILNKVGLSKDNFNDADAESLIQRLESMDETMTTAHSNPLSQSRIDSFFQPLVSSKPPSQPPDFAAATVGIVGSTSATGSVSSLSDTAMLTGLTDEELASLMEADFDGSFT